MDLELKGKVAVILCEPRPRPRHGTSPRAEGCTCPRARGSKASRVRGVDQFRLARSEVVPVTCDVPRGGVIT